MAIPNNTVVMHHQGNVAEEIHMGIRSEDFPFLADMLNSLYSDVIAAPVREYSTNALDSHVAAGVTRPIEITLPTESCPEFVVQDFGLGMSADDLRNTYAFYGASDKRGSNSTAGQLGVGSKSALSYAVGFTVVAVKDHEKVSAYVTKDERGLGVIKFLAPPAATDEPNGVQIKIPVGRDDVEDFREAADDLFQFWSPGTVLIDGEAPETPEWATSALRIDADTWLVRSDAGLDSSYVIMGNVPYPVNDVWFNSASHRFVARLNIGDVDFVPSREEVKHTPWTDETLSDLKDYISTHFRRVLNDAITGATTAWEEVQIKMLWKGAKGTTLHSTNSDRKIWTYNPSVSWGRKSQAHNAYRLHNLISSSTVVITGFTAKNVSAVAKERLTELFGSKADFVILPTGTRGTHLLDGRPNTHPWADVVDTTAKPKAPRGSRGPKVETVYNTNNGGMTADQLAAVDGKVLYLYPQETARYGSLDATVVYLYSGNQLPRIQRYVPSIRHYDEEATDQRKAAAAAITPHDKRIVGARTLPDTFKKMDPSKVHDPDLVEAIRLAKAADTPTMVAARRFQITIDPIQPINFTKRYPLATGGYYADRDAAMVAERLFYVNARYDARIAEQAQVAS